MKAHYWRIPWTEGPGGLQSIGLQGVKTRLGDLAHMRVPSPMGCEPLQNRVFAFVSSLYLAQRMDYNVYSVNVGWLNE